MIDNTEHPTREGKVYCAVVLDAFSRRVVGWSITQPDGSATANALGMDPASFPQSVVVGVDASPPSLQAGAVSQALAERS